MDAPLLAVAAERGYERGLGEQYHQHMEDLIPCIVSDTSQNGFVLKYSGTEWRPLEYAWQTVTEEDGLFVSNGSFYGMVGIEPVKEVTDSPRLKGLSEKALNAYKGNADGSYYPDGGRRCDSLRNSNGAHIINRPEKLLIEIQALRALHLLTEGPFYQQEANRREDLLANLLPLYIVAEEDGTRTAMLPRAGAPHPYMVNIYPSTLEILNESRGILTTLEAGNRSVSNSCLMGNVPDGAASYRLYGKVSPIEKTLLVEQPVTRIKRGA